MDKISQGLQYSVYKQGNRVIKIPTSRMEKIKILLSWEKKLWISPLQLVRKLLSAETITKKSLDIFVGNKKIPSYLIGNPKFGNKNISQDFVTLWGNYLNTSDHEAQFYIDGYISFLIECWKYGFSDTVFNPTINNGIDIKGRIMLIDLGECSSNKGDIASIITQKIWEYQWSYTNDMPQRARKYYQSAMEKTITLKNLEKYWGILL